MPERETHPCTACPECDDVENLCCPSCEGTDQYCPVCDCPAQHCDFQEDAEDGVPFEPDDFEPPF